MFNKWQNWLYLKKNYFHFPCSIIIVYAYLKCVTDPVPPCIMSEWAERGSEYN